jgi:hypothetical protein
MNTANPVIGQPPSCDGSYHWIVMSETVVLKRVGFGAIDGATQVLNLKMFERAPFPLKFTA